MRPFLAAALACAGVAALSSTPAQALTYTFAPVAVNGCRSDCPVAIVATGEVSLSAAEDLLARLEPFVRSRRPMAGTLIIDSPGGYLVGALKLGIVIRELKLNVMVASYQGPSQLGTARCNSACAYILAAGVKRFVPDGSAVGVHKSYDAGVSQRDILGGGMIDAVRPAGSTDEVLGRYLARMGVSRDLLKLVNATPSSDIRTLTRSELGRFRLASAIGGSGEKRRPKRRDGN